MTFAPARHFALLAPGDFNQLTPQAIKPLLHNATIDFNLLFARTARANSHGRAAGDLSQVLPHGAQARRGVLQLRNLNLQLRLARGGAIGEDVQNKFTAINHLATQRLLESLQLTRRKIVVKNHNTRLELLHHEAKLLHFALA